MREIKFRAWDKEAKKMLDWNILRNNQVGFVHSLIGEGNWIGMQFTGLKDKNGKEIYDKDLVRVSFICNPDAKEKHWKYECEAFYQVNIGLFEVTMDMVNLKKPEMMVDHLHLGAKDYWWDGSIFKIGSKYFDGEKTRSDGEIEVIGNIYENPKLLVQPTQPTK